MLTSLLRDIMQELQPENNRNDSQMSRKSHNRTWSEQHGTKLQNNLLIVTTVWSFTFTILFSILGDFKLYSFSTWPCSFRRREKHIKKNKTLKSSSKSSTWSSLSELNSYSQCSTALHQEQHMKRWKNKANYRINKNIFTLKSNT